MLRNEDLKYICKQKLCWQKQLITALWTAFGIHWAMAKSRWNQQFSSDHWSDAKLSPIHGWPCWKVVRCFGQICLIGLRCWQWSRCKWKTILNWRRIKEAYLSYERCVCEGWSDIRVLVKVAVSLDCCKQSQKCCHFRAKQIMTVKKFKYY